MKKLLGAWGHSLAGLHTAWANERAFRQEAIAAGVLLPVMWLLGIAGPLKLALILLLLLLLVVELLNSALETAVNRISTEIHPLSKDAKDMGSAAVLVVIAMNVCAWLYAIGDMLSR